MLDKTSCFPDMFAPSEPLLIQAGQVWDPVTAEVTTRDLFIEKGVVGPLPSTLPADCKAIDAAGCVVVPGLIDMHVHLREPGNEEAETVVSGCSAAARGGFAAVVAMPNTSPPLDSPELVSIVRTLGAEAGRGQRRRILHSESRNNAGSDAASCGLSSDCRRARRGWCFERRGGYA